MHVFHEILAERDEEKDAQDSSQHGGDEHFHEVHRHFRIFVLQDIEGGQGEYGSGHNHTGTCPDALDDDVLAQCPFPVGGSRHAYRDNRDGDGRFEHLSYFQS